MPPGEAPPELEQSAHGYRFSVDSFLVAHFARPRGSDRLADLGTGNGIIALLLARRYPRVRLVGVEIQGELARMAAKNVASRGLSDRVTIVQGDLRRARHLFRGGCFDGAVGNPPYWRVGTGRRNPSAEKAGARHELHITLAECVAAAAHLVRPRGRVWLVTPSGRLVDLLASFTQCALRPLRLRSVHARRGEEATAVLVEAARGGGRELHVEEPFYLYEENGYTREAQLMYEAFR